MLSPFTNKTHMALDLLELVVGSEVDDKHTIGRAVKETLNWDMCYIGT